MFENDRTCCQNNGDCTCHACTILTGVFGTTPYCRGCKDYNADLLNDIIGELNTLYQYMREQVVIIEFSETPIPEGDTSDESKSDTSDESGDDTVTNP